MHLNNPTCYLEVVGRTGHLATDASLNKSPGCSLSIRYIALSVFDAVFTANLSDEQVGVFLELRPETCQMHDHSSQ